jgi:hypothetical protein
MGEEEEFKPEEDFMILFDHPIRKRQRRITTGWNPSKTGTFRNGTTYGNPPSADMPLGMKLETSHRIHSRRQKPFFGSSDLSAQAYRVEASIEPLMETPLSS